MTTVILIVGFPAAGKSTVAQEAIDQGYLHINRDKEGGTVKGLLPLVEDSLKRKRDVVLDNTFPTIESRKPFIELAKQYGAKVVCYLMDSTLEDAQFNACSRIVKMYGHLLDNAEIKKSKHPNTFPMAVLYGYRKEFQKPVKSEGFDEIKVIPFVRRKDPTYKNKALLLDYDGTLRDTKSGAKFPTRPDDIYILPNRVELLKAKQKEGYLLLGVSNQSGVEKGDLTLEMAKDCFKKTNELLGLDIEVSFCPHKVPPISCYCRKPGAGMGVAFIEKHKLDPSQCVVVGDLKSDETFASRCGMMFKNAEEFFSQ